jgi:spore coat protein U-like protein
LRKRLSILGLFFLFMIPSSTLLYGQCSVSAVGVNFGNYEPLNTVQSTSTGTISVSCASNSTVTVLIGASPNSGGFNPRKMASPSGNDLLIYNLYTSSAMNVIWGDGTGGTSTIQRSVLKKRPVYLTVYGRAPASQNVAVGLYGEALMVTINF